MRSLFLLFLMDIFVRWFLDLWISLDLASHQTCGLHQLGQALEGTSDDSAVMEPNEHLAVFFGLYGRYEAHRSTDILNRNLTYVNYCQLRCPWFEFSMYLDVCFSAFCVDVSSAVLMLFLLISDGTVQAFAPASR